MEVFVDAIALFAPLFGTKTFWCRRFGAGLFDADVLAPTRHTLT